LSSSGECFNMTNRAACLPPWRLRNTNEYTL